MCVIDIKTNDNVHDYMLFLQSFNLLQENLRVMDKSIKS